MNLPSHAAKTLLLLSVTALSALAQAPLAPPALAPPALALAPHARVLDISGTAGHFTEPAIALNPNQPGELIAVYQGGPRVQGLGAAAYSTDAGKTFTTARQTALSDWRVVGDVTATFDNRGRAFWCYLAFDRLGTTSYWAHNATRNGIFVRRSLDHGRTWEKAIAVKAFPTGHEPTVHFEDEPRIFADTSAQSPFAGNLYVGWVEWQIDRSIMLFSRSTDAGQTWSTPARIDAHAGLPRDDNGALGGFMQTIAPDGTLHAIWSDGNTIVFAVSHDAGRTFSRPRPILETAPPYFGELPGVSRASGFPQIVYDSSTGPHHGRLYVTWSDYRNGDVDVFVSSSSDAGRTWTPALRVNDDPIHDGKDQFFQSTTLDPVTGALYLMFYDRRSDPQNSRLNITLARSVDGGQSFRNYAWTNSAWDPQNAFLGDYTWITAYNNRVYAVWTETVPQTSPAKKQPVPRPAPQPRTGIRVGSADFSQEAALSPVRRNNSTITSAMPYAIKVEYAQERKIRERNKVIYRVAHWPIWIWVFFLAPGPLTFDLFAHGPNVRNLIWLFVVLFGTGIAGLFGQLPGVEPRPYILRFSEDKPNPLYRRICYTFAWNALLSFALLNLLGLIVAVLTHRWYLQQIYVYGYLPVFLVILSLGLFGFLPRVKPSTRGEGTERRYFYGAVWSVTLAQALLLPLWKVLPRGHSGDVFKLATFVFALAAAGAASALGLLPRTRPILPGELMVAD